MRQKETKKARNRSCEVLKATLKISVFILKYGKPLKTMVGGIQKV